MTVRELLLVSLIVLTPFQDTALQRTPLAALGCSFAVVPLVALVVLDIGAWLVSPEKRVNLSMAAVAAYTGMLTGLYLILFGATWCGIDLRLKALNLTLMTALAAWVVVRPEWSSFRYLRIATWSALAVCLAGVAMHDLNFMGLGSIARSGLFHATVNPDERWHGFSREVSMLSLTIGSLGLLSAWVARGRAARIAFIITTVAALALCGSKGGILSIALAAVVVCTFSRGHRVAVVSCIIVCLPLAYLGYQRLEKMSAVQSAMETTTFASRGTLALWTAEVVVHHPFGVGFSGMYPAFTRHLPAAMDRASSLSPVPLNFEEVRSYQSTDRSASTKSALFDYMAFFGVPFLAVFAALMFKVVRTCLRHERVLLMTTFLFVIFAMCTYNNSLVHYNTFLILGVCWDEYRKLRNTSSCL